MLTSHRKQDTISFDFSLKQRMLNILFVLEFAVRTIWALCLQRKASVTWKRESPKTMTLSVTFLNHLFDDEIEALKREQEQQEAV